MNLTSVDKGNIFEEKVYKIIKDLVQKSEFGLVPALTKVFWKKSYYSEKRKADIEFDIAIESYLPNADQPTTIYLFECKNYKKKVPVKDIETFASKLNQVGEHNTKGFFVTNNYYQKAALELARSYKLGVMVINGEDKHEWLSYRTQSGSVNNDLNHINLILSGENSDNISFFAELDGWAIRTLPSLLTEAGIISNYTPIENVKLEFLTEETLAYKITQLGIDKCYKGLQLDIDKLCELASILYDVDFDFTQSLGENSYSKILGKIIYDPLQILVDKNLKNDVNRFRFTICHEIGHLVLHAHLLSDYYDSMTDIESTFGSSTKLEKKEFQANMFASQILLPKSLIEDFVFKYFAQNDIYKGHLLLDSQRGNETLVFNLLYQITDAFMVSAEVAKIRLIRLGLLKTHGSSLNSMNDILRQTYKH